MKRNIALISVGFDGFSLEETLEGFSKTRSTNVCLCALDQFTHHVLPERMSREEWEETKLLFQDFGLFFYGLEGHCDVSDPKNLDKIQQRLRFTRFMSGKYVDMSAGPTENRKRFFKNMEAIAGLAEELEVLFCLETHGDIISSGKDGSEVIKELGSPWVRLCYDPANVYFYSEGRINPVEDLKDAIESIGLLHFKGVNHNGGKTLWTFPFMADSIFSYADFFEVLHTHHYDKMVAIEIEKMFLFEKDRGFVKEKGWTADAIIDAYNREIDFLSGHLR